MKHVVLIDMENMNHEGYEGLENLNKSFDIVFFESKFSVKIPPRNLKMLDEKGIGYNFEWCERNRLNKDSMDFCIVAYLALRSSLIGREECYYVLSKDSDFEVPSSYIKGKLGIQVKLAATIAQILKENNLKDVQITPEQIIQMCIKQSKSKDQFHCLLQKTLKGFYSSKQITNIYKVHKNKLKNNQIKNNHKPSAQ